MDNFLSYANDLGSERALQGKFASYFKTAGTVLLGWLLVTWIWHITTMLFAPAVVSALAIFLICPTTLDWFLREFGPTVESWINSMLNESE